MCGIAGIFNLERPDPVPEQDIRQMLAMIRHRGPDEFGIYLDRPVGLGSARLSIIDLSTGQQPIANEDETLWIVFNGEVFNYVELRPELQAKGHRFTTSSDTEVLLHAYEEWGPDCLQRLNGQFALAIWSTRDRSLFLARDRLGVRPLFYTVKGGSLVFGSEIKALLASGRVSAVINPSGLEQVFTYWAPLSPGTVFKDIVELSPGHYLLAREGEVTVRKYWELNFPDPESRPTNETSISEEEYVEALAEVLIDSTRIRLRADVPVGAYLSGGLDSSLIASIVRNFTGNRLDTFSIAFEDASFDESAFQQQMARFLGTQHQVVQASHSDIARVFPQVVWHAEVPLLRTAPAPMFLLSKLVRDSGYKVVLTGEGADEFLAGYDIFKEAKVRRFWAARPDSGWRPLLFKRLYPDIKGLSLSNVSLLAAFFREGLKAIDSPSYSHALRWRNGRRNCRFLSDEIRQKLPKENQIENLLQDVPGNWEPLARAQFLEIKTFLSQYLLSSQGDRMGMANSIEGRFPYLDCRLVEFCNRLPARMKLRGLTEKYLLKKLGRKWLPKEIWQRPKRPYRAPIHRSLFNSDSPDYIRELLEPEAVARAGLFNPQAVARLVQKARHGESVGESDDMALAGILSAQLIQYQFVERFTPTPPVSDKDNVKVRPGGGPDEMLLHQEAVPTS
jgi:asparagine synthase (glutamine-hydrolysing)